MLIAEQSSRISEPITYGLLKHIRDCVTSKISAFDKISKSLQVVCEEMQAKACCLYVRNDNHSIELFDYFSKLPVSPFRNRIVSEDDELVQCLENNKSFSTPGGRIHDPDYINDYKPATMATPLVIGNKKLGVLMLVGSDSDEFSEEMLSTLQTVSMILASILKIEYLDAEKEPKQSDISDSKLSERSHIFDGICVTPGTGYGVAVFHEPKVNSVEMLADNPEEERSRLTHAMDEMLAAINKLFLQHGTGEGKEYRDILETYQLFARDQGWRRRIMESINTGLSAESAVQKVMNSLKSRLEAAGADNWRERAVDLEDLSNRLIRHLSGDLSSPFTNSDNDGIVVIANRIGPAELLDYDRDKLRGVLLTEKAHTAHVAIVAKSLGIPIISGISQIASYVSRGDPILLDGEIGRLYVRPKPRLLRQLDKRCLLKQEADAPGDDSPVLTLDGHRVYVMLNAGLRIDIKHLKNADSVGLYRTEIPFMVRNTLPTVEEQTNLYSSIFRMAEGKEVVFRTLDIGGDKILPYMPYKQGENPALGWRAVRMTIDRPILLRHQLRAILRASEGRSIKILVPMISNVSEYIRVKQIVELEMAEQEKLGYPRPKEIKCGAMIEVPSIVFEMDNLLPMVDFVSLGSNDLHQFFFAVDRSLPKLIDRYDTLSPIFLRLLKQVVDKCHAAGVPITVCGEIAGRPLEALALVGLGYRRLSMAPSSLRSIRQTMNNVNTEHISEFMNYYLNQPISTIRHILKSFARDNGHQVM